jgi:sugar (pentulose or hexulose) kinase
MIPTQDTLLSLDCGTQSLRAMLFSGTGALIHKVKIDYEPYQSSRPGWAEQDADLYWASLCDAVRTLKMEAREAFGRIKGVGVTTQRDTLIFLDRTGRPLRPALTWLDTRKARAVYKPVWFKALAFRAVGMLEAIQKTQKECKASWVRQNEPAVWDATTKILQVSGFLNHRLTGNYRDSVASQIGHIPFNYKKMRWCRKGELGSLLFPIELSKLPELVPAGTLLGTITGEAALATGLPEGLPVIACASDKGAETIGIGCVDETMASLSLGTTATVQTTSPRYFEPIAFMPPYPAAMARHYNPEVEIFRGYWMISWFKRELAPREVNEALEQGVAPEAILDRFLREVPAGCMGLLTLPHWGPSLKLPGTKGAMIGFGDVHTRGYLYRSVLEGLAFGLREGLEKIEKAGGRRIERIGISGGATQSREICQLTADIFGRELTAGETFETAGLGAAAITAVGVGLYPTIPEAVAAMVRHGHTYSPRPEQAALYDQLYRKVYRKLYSRLKPLYREIRAIVNYPERASDERPEDF